MSKKKVQLLMPEETYKDLAGQAKKMGTSISALINIAVVEYLSRE